SAVSLLPPLANEKDPRPGTKVFRGTTLIGPPHHGRPTPRRASARRSGNGDPVGAYCRRPPAASAGFGPRSRVYSAAPGAGSHRGPSGGRDPPQRRVPPALWSQGQPLTLPAHRFDTQVVGPSLAGLTPPVNGHPGLSADPRRTPGQPPPGRPRRA